MNTVIKFDHDDPLNTKYEENEIKQLKDNFGKNFSIFFKEIFSYSIRSKIIWFLGIILPVLLLIIDYLIYGLSLQANGVLTDKIVSDLVNWIFLTPIMALTIIALPGFIVQSRETNLLKRLKINGSSKIQITLNYFLSSFIITTIVILFLFGPGVFAANLLGEQLSGVEHNNPYLAFGSISLDYFIPLLIFGIAGSIMFGYFIGMKMNSSRSVIYVGTSIYVYAAFTGGFLVFFNINVLSKWDDQSISGKIGDLVVLMFKYSFFLTPTTLINTSLLIVSNKSEYAFHDGLINNKNSNELLYYITIYMAFSVSIAIVSLTTIYNRNLTNFEAGR